jgi:protoporphyrinogen oxidase
LVAGAGLAGLSAAYHADGAVHVLDRADVVGGTARSHTVGGFTFDVTGHLLHLHDPYTQAWIPRLLGDNLVSCRRDARIYAQGVLTPYPFQANLYGRSPRVIRDCLDGLRRSRARWGDRPLEGTLGPGGDSTLTFRDWSRRLFGDGITRHFMAPYNRKLWGVSVDDLRPDWCGSFVPVPTLEEVEAGAHRVHRKAFGYNASFLYPKRGGIQVLAEALAREVNARRGKEIRLGVSLDKVLWKKRQARLGDGSVMPYRRLISTLALPELVKRLDPFPEELAAPLARLRWTTVMCLNVGVARSRISPASWIYFPEKSFPFYRVGFPMNFTPHVAPRGCSSMYVEVSYRPGTEPTDTAGRTRLFRRVREGLLRAGIVRSTDTYPVVQFLPIRYAYVIYDAYRTAAVATILDWLDRRAAADSIGRYGGWKYSFMEAALLDGKRFAEAL